MAQNIYDKQEFFDRYTSLRKSIEGLPAALESPSMIAMIPDLQGRRALDLGCGLGWYCRQCCEHGASYVLGIDLSEKMLRRAQELTDDKRIEYKRADLEQLILPEASFDFVVSSLAFHYIENLSGLLAQIYRALNPGGQLLFSAEHPVFTASMRSGCEWLTDESGRKVWPLDSYLMDGKRVKDYFSEKVVKIHRSLSTYMNLLINTGFTITKFVEWTPNVKKIEAMPELAKERDLSMFILIKVTKQ
ncbi:SAM-dependent methyltransferase-like protein [Dinothrombium tinctorium]|uniref:SAM-dependent methyltransferase-like protein n=1 Tax=Dinothrombium tinctorium TaxID=1965070 RepID=A0A3S3P2T2_9ACAR|nr:SAM-dependent methyltransferase-like protein [Dinothrombium tinctorium]